MLRHNSDVDVALLEDTVIGQKAVEIIEHLGEGLAELADVVEQRLRQVLMDAAGAEVRRVHAAAAGALVKYHQLFALFEAPQRRRQRADIHRLRGDVEEV